MPSPRTRKLAHRRSVPAETVSKRIEEGLKGIVQDILNAKGYESKMLNPSVNSLTAEEAQKEIHWALGGGKKFAIFQGLAKLALEPEKTLERIKPSQIEEIAESIVGPVNGVDLGQAAMARDIPSKAKSMVDETKQTIYVILTMLRQSRHPKIQLLIRHIVSKLKRSHPDLAKRLAAAPRVAAIKNQKGGGMKLLYAVILLGFLAHVFLLGNGSLEPMFVFDFAVLTKVLSILKLTPGINPGAKYDTRMPHVLGEPQQQVLSAFKLAEDKESKGKQMMETQEANALANAKLRTVAGSTIRLGTMGGPGGAELLASPFATGFAAAQAAEKSTSEASRSLAKLQASSRQTAAELKGKKASTIYRELFGYPEAEIKQLEAIYNTTQAEIARYNATVAIAGGAPSLDKAGDVLAIAATSAIQSAGLIVSNPESINPAIVGPSLVRFLESSVKATTELDRALDANTRSITNTTDTLEDLRGEIEADAARLIEVDAEVEALNGKLATLTDELRDLYAENEALPGRILTAKEAANAKWASLGSWEARGTGEKTQAYQTWETLDTAHKDLKARQGKMNAEIEKKTSEISRVVSERGAVGKEQTQLLTDLSINRAEVARLEGALGRYEAEKLQLEAKIANANATTTAIKGMQGRLAAIADGDADRGTLIPKGTVMHYTVDPSSREVIPVLTDTDLAMSVGDIGTGGLFRTDPRPGSLVSFSARYAELGELSAVMDPSLPMTGDLTEALGSLTALVNADRLTGAIVLASENDKPVDPEFGRKVVASFGGGEGELSVPGKIVEAVAQAYHTELKLAQAEEAFEALETAESHLKEEIAVRVFKQKARELTDAYMSYFGPAYPGLNRTTVEGHVNHFLTLIITEFQAFPKEGMNNEIAGILDTVYIHPPKERPGDLLTHEEVMFQMNIHKDKLTRVLYRLDKAKWDLVVTGLLGGLAVILTSLPTGIARILSNLLERFNVGIESSTAIAKARGEAAVASIRRPVAAPGRTGSPGAAAGPPVAAVAGPPGADARPRRGSRWGPAIANDAAAAAAAPVKRPTRWGNAIAPAPAGSIWGPGSPLTLNQQVELSARIAAAKLRGRAGSNAGPRGHGGGGGRKTRKQILRRRRSTRRAG